jgi:hypothetical protein
MNTTAISAERPRSTKTVTVQQAMELLDDRRVKVARPLIPWVAGVGGVGRRAEGGGRREEEGEEGRGRSGEGKGWVY